MIIRRVGIERLKNDVRLASAIVLMLVFGMAILPASAADNNNDGNTHDTNDGPGGPEDEGTDGGEDDDCHRSSPVLIKSGEFVWSDTDIVLKGRPTIELSRYYRSFDSREGIFGKGWSTRCEKMLVRVLDYVLDDPNDPNSTSSARLGYIYRRSNGRRFTFTENDTGGFEAPVGLPGVSLSVEDDGTTTLSAMDGSQEKYNALGVLISEIDRNGNAVEYSYINGVIERIGDTNGRFLKLAYDSTGHVASVTDHTGRQWRYSYNSDGSLAKMTDAAGGVRVYEYETITRLASSQTYPVITRIVDASNTDVIGVSYAETGKVESYSVGENTYTYSEARGFVYKTDSMRAKWGYLTDEKGQKTEVYSPLNASEPERYEYNEDGKVTRYTDLAGTEFSREYDTFGRLTSHTTVDGTTSIGYVDGTDWPATVTSPSGRLVRFTRDARGNMTTATDPAGNAGSLRWSPAGDLLALTDPLGNTQTRTVDAAGLLISVTDPLGHITTLTRDERGNVIEITDALGGRTTLEYDILDRLLVTSDALGRRILRAYDEAGRLLSITDPAGGVTTFERDSFGRVIRESRPDGSEYTYTYRMDNLPATATDPNGVVKTYTYDRERRLTNLRSGRIQFNYTRDSLGRITRATGGGALLNFTYDAMSRMTSESQGETLISYTYNNDGELVASSALDEQLVYSRDERGLISSFTTPAGTHEYAYDTVGRMLAHTLPNGAITTMEYDVAGRLVEQDDTPAGGELYGYTYDAIGRIKNKTTTGAADRQYLYDAIGRLTSAEHEGSYLYEYDVLGNRLEQGGVYDAFNKLLEDDNYTYTYDANGSLISRLSKTDGVETRYIYDEQQRLTTVETVPTDGPVERIRYSYDAIGRRSSKRDNEGLKTFRWSGFQLIAEYDNGDLTCTYRYDGGHAAAEFSDPGGSWYVRQDYLHTPQNLLDDSGDASPLDATDPYGALVAPAAESSPTFNQRLPGQYVDRDTGLSYNVNRYYDPSTGRYTRDDPSGLAGGLNAYLYGGSSPTSRIDPLGLRDFFFVLEGELVYILGFEGGIGVVYDSDSPGESGLFLNAGLSYGINAGFGAAIGVANGDIEGFSVGFDVNGPGLNSTVFGGLGGDGSVFYGGGLGLGGGTSVGVTGTVTYTWDDFVDWLTRPFRPDEPSGPCS